MSEILLIPNSNGKKASIEGMCEKCNAHFQVFYEQTETIVTEFNDFMEEIAKTKI